MPTPEHYLIDFKNAVEQMAGPRVLRKPLLPVFEAIHNPIQSIQQAKRDTGEIIAQFIRKDGDMDPKCIVEIVISDNGIGFTKDNILSFGKLFTDHKKDNFNCKGIGRLAYFATFFDVAIESVYEDGERLFKLEETVTEKNFYRIFDFKPIEVKNLEINTKIKLKKLNPKHQQLYKIPQERIKNELTDHFLPSLLSIKNIKIKIIDEDTYYLGEDTKGVTEDDPVVIGSDVFNIYHLKNRAPHRSSHEVILSADGRSVKRQPIGFLPRSKIGEGDDKFYLNTVVSSDYLDKNLNADRTDFNIPKTKGLLDGVTDLESIYEKVFESSRRYSRDSIKHLEGVLDRFIEDIFDELPHLSFLREDKDVKNSLRLGDDVNIVKDAYIRKFAEKQVESFNFVKTITHKYETNEIPNFDEFQKESLKKLEEGMRINHAPLVSYIKYRDFVLRFYDKLLERKEDGKYQPEKTLHNLLFPIKTDSENAKADYFKHNLWIIDDRYAVYDFVTSDLPESAVYGSNYDPKDKRYDICAAYSDPMGEGHNVFIVELKKTSLSLSANNDPIEQIKKYVQDMISGRLKKYNGKRIKITESTQFFGLALCDVHSNYFKDYMVSGHSLKMRPDSKSYHAVMLNERFFLEVTNYENLLDIARARNKVFIDKLNYKR